MIGRYKHTQIGTALLIAFGIAMLITLMALFLTKEYFPSAVIFGVLFFFAGLFASLTIEVLEGLLCWRFGPGLIRGKTRLADIQAVDIVKNPWWYGIGIHLTPHGWLYNVSGLGSVEITLTNGKRFRLGTDEPDDLALAIKNAISSSHT
jgi:hypothetical protein